MRQLLHHSCAAGQCDSGPQALPASNGVTTERHTVCELLGGSCALSICRFTVLSKSQLVGRCRSVQFPLTDSTVGKFGYIHYRLCNATNITVTSISQTGTHEHSTRYVQSHCYVVLERKTVAERLCAQGARFRYQANRCDICGLPSGTGRGSLSEDCSCTLSVPFCQYPIPILILRLPLPEAGEA